MKNSLKNKKSIIIAARVMLVLLLLTSAVSLGGCTDTFRYYRPREVYTSHTYPTTFMVTSSTNIFAIDNIALDLQIGVHKLSIFGKMDDYPKGQYAYGYSNRNIGFVLYICDGYLSTTFPYLVEDIKNVDGHLFIKEIPEEQAFSREYGYNLFKCNHVEKITIPPEYVNEDRGSFVIKLATYFNSCDSNDLDYKFSAEGYIFSIVLEYEKTDDDRITITNFYEK